MTFTTGDRIQAWSKFLEWWAIRVGPDGPSPATEDYYAKDAAGAAWLAACEWMDTLRGDD